VVTRPDRKCDLSVAEPSRRGANTAFIEVQAVQNFGEDTKRAMQVAERLTPRLSLRNKAETITFWLRYSRSSIKPAAAER